ncbi:unnamed protein product, partial [Prorocentrum cordatum]
DRVAATTVDYQDEKLESSEILGQDITAEGLASICLGNGIDIDARIGAGTNTDDCIDSLIISSSNGSHLNGDAPEFILNVITNIVESTEDDRWRQQGWPCWTTRACGTTIFLNDGDKNEKSYDSNLQSGFGHAHGNPER